MGRSVAGMVIAFEGIDGSGKGVQVNEVAARLRSMDKKIRIQDFPVYSGFYGKEIGKMLSGEYAVRADEVDPRSMTGKLMIIYCLTARPCPMPRTRVFV